MPNPPSAAQSTANLWDDTLVKALLQLPRFPLRHLQQPRLQAWLDERGGLAAVYRYLREYPLPRAYRLALDVILDNPGAVAEHCAGELNISRTSYFGVLRELVPMVAHTLNQWQPAALLPDTPVSTAPVPPPRLDNLPAQLTRLVGVEETTQRSLQIMREGARLLTLVGPGGIGKTRLSLELAQRLQAEFAAGVLWISLAPVRDSALVLPTIAQALGLNNAPNDQLHERLLRSLSDKQLLLVLDNFEHVLDARFHIRDMLQAAPGLRLIITSRAPLKIYGEHEFDVPSLAYPAPDEADPARIAATPAVALFLHHAQAVKADFTLTADNAADIAELCRALDGLPLALELAAAQSKLLSPVAMLGRLNNRLAFLRNGPADAPARHQTMRSALDWSYALLTEEQRRVFARMAVFAGGCTLDAATAVCALAEDPLDVVECLQALADQSLVYLETRPNSADRLVMLETIREYALLQLEASSETGAIRASHASYYLELARHEGAALGGDHQQQALNRLNDERDNLRIALQWAIDSNAGALGLHLVSCLWKFWRALGYQTEGRRFMQAVLEQTTTLASAERATALHGAGWLAADQNDQGAAQHYFQDCLALCEQLEDPTGIGLALQGLAEIDHINARYEEARRGCMRALEIFRTSGHQEEIGWILDRLGRIALDLRDLDEAQARFTESLALFQAVNHNWGQAIVLFHLGQAYRYQGNFQLARDLFEQCVSHSRQMGELRSSVVAMALNHLALIELTLNHVAHAQSLAHECLELSRQAGYAVVEIDARISLARIAAQAGNLPQALEYFRQCGASIQQHHGPAQVALLVEALGPFALRLGAEHFAAQLAGWNASLLEQHHFPGVVSFQKVNQELYATLAARLPAAELSAHWEQGRALDFASGIRTITAGLQTLSSGAAPAA